MPVNAYPYSREKITRPECDSCQKKESSTEELARAIRERLGKVDISVSSYDTAWVAMVPSNNHHHHQQQRHPRFPECLEWIMENQNADGSWGLNHNTHPHPSLVKDSLSSTLASVLALHKWEVGEQLVHKGLDYIGSKRYSVMDKQQSSPMGFDIIFPGMINQAHALGLNLPLDSDFVNIMLRNRDLQLQRLKGKGELVAYYAEGVGESYDWKELLKNEQRSNGSLFNSPATTAAALIHFYDDKCFHYLHSLLDIHGKAVPSIYPFDVYLRLCMVDTLYRLGIDRYFKHEIKVILDETHRYVPSDVAAAGVSQPAATGTEYQLSVERSRALTGEQPGQLKQLVLSCRMKRQPVNRADLAVD